MKTLFIGGIKSGKSRLAEVYILEHSCVKPYYLATAEIVDEEMRQRILVHQQRRQDRFVSIEEPIRLAHAIQQCPGPVLIECVSMWLNNMLYYQRSEKQILDEIKVILALPNDMVFVLNEVGLGVIAADPLTRQFVDLSGKIAQLLAAHCERVFFCSAGLKLSLK